MPRNLLLALIIAVTALGGAGCTVEKADSDKDDKNTESSDDDGSSSDDDDSSSSDESSDDEDPPVTAKPDAGRKDGGTLIDAGGRDAGKRDGGVTPSRPDAGDNCFTD